jgi:signal transduction histidine kinase/CheY-like chemotaxis protein/AraC-like DNA-binding protein
LLLFKLYSDSIAKENNSKDLNELQIKFETVTKDNEINTLKVDAATQKLKLERVRVYVVLFIGLFVIVAVLVVFLWQRSKNAKKIQAKLQEINDIKTAFFANLSHEFRTPLTLMLGPAEKLLEKAGPEDKPLLQLIHRNASRLLDLDEQLLEFTRIDSGNQKLKLVKGDIVLLISGIATSFQLAAQKKHISFEQNYPNDLPEVLFDPDIIEKVIGNLISNAIKYTPSGGRVEIIVALEESENVLPDKQAHNGSNHKIMIGVNDNGAGIPNEKQKLIFERFYQLNNYSSGIYDGYGIGLALVKELVNLHKGEVVLKSTVGIGSNFSVYIPYVQDTYSKEELKHISRYVNNLNSVEDSVVIDEQKIGSEISDGVLREDNQQIKSNKLLIVDDNQDMRTYLIELLRESYEILEASDGKEGLSLAIQQMPDLIVTDIMMDTMDGIEFCKQLKSNSQTRHIPVIMLTALAELDDKVLGLENGADDYIVKPFVAKELMARIRNLIIQRILLKDLFTKELRLEPTAVSISSADAVFIQKLIGIIEKNIDNPDLDIAFFASAIGISRSQLHRKVIALTGQAATNFIRIIRIRRAAQLMSQKTGNISEIMYSVGFNNPSYFSKCFKEIYNMTPTDFMNN